MAARTRVPHLHIYRVCGGSYRLLTECLDHVVVLNERHLRRLLKKYLAYYHSSRTHLALRKDAPEPRAVMKQGAIVAILQVGGLHHRYERRAA